MEEFSKKSLAKAAATNRTPGINSSSWELQWTQDFLPEHHFCHGPLCTLSQRLLGTEIPFKKTKCKLPAGKNKPGNILDASRSRKKDQVLNWQIHF